MTTELSEPIEQIRLPDEHELDALVEHVIKYPKLREYVLSLQNKKTVSTKEERQTIREVLDTTYIAVVDGFTGGRTEPPLPKKAITVGYPFGDGEAEFLLWYDEQDGGIVPVFSGRDLYITEAK